MDGFLEALYNLLSSPLLLFTFILIAVALSIIAVVTTLLVARRLSSMITSITSRAAHTSPPTTTSTPPPASHPPPSRVSISQPISKTTNFIKITSGLETLEEISSALTVNSIFLFNLTGMSIESYNVKEEEMLAAALADIVATLKKSGFPTDAITIKDGVQGLILSVSQVGDMEVYALLLSGPEVSVDVEEARELLRNYVSSIVKRRGE